MNIQQFNTRFNELVTEEVHHLRDNLTPSQKRKLRVRVLDNDLNCVYFQIFGYYRSTKAMELKSPTMEKARKDLNFTCFYMGIMEVYIDYCQLILPKKQWQAAKSRLVNVIKGKTTEPLIPFNAAAKQIKYEFQLVSPLRAK